MDPQALQLVLFGGVAVLLVLLMVRNSRKRTRDQAELGRSLKPGAEIMTTFGVFGRVVSVDDAENKIVLETSPGNTLTLHRQAMGRVVTPTEPGDDAPVEQAASTATLNGEPIETDFTGPRFGQRVDGAERPTDSQDGTRPAARTSRESPDQ